jgi:hypothetical protein
MDKLKLGNVAVSEKRGIEACARFNSCIKFLLGTKVGTSVRCDDWSIAFLNQKEKRDEQSQIRWSRRNPFDSVARARDGKSARPSSSRWREHLLRDD